MEGGIDGVIRQILFYNEAEHANEHDQKACVTTGLKEGSELSQVFENSEKFSGDNPIQTGSFSKFSTEFVRLKSIQRPLLVKLIKSR